MCIVTTKSGIMLKEQKLKGLVAEFAKSIKTEDDLNPFSRLLTKLTILAALNAGLTLHLGHERKLVSAVLMLAMVIQVRPYG